MGILSLSVGYMLTIEGKNNLWFKAIVFLGAFLPLAYASYLSGIILLYIAGLVFGHMVAVQTDSSSSDSMGFWGHLSQLRAPEKPGATEHPFREAQKPTDEEIEEMRAAYLFLLQKMRAENQEDQDSPEEADSEDNDTRTAHEILRVSKNANKAEIKKAYKYLANKYHSDKHPNSSDDLRSSLDREFIKVKEAYDKLK